MGVAPGGCVGRAAGRKQESYVTAEITQRPFQGIIKSQIVRLPLRRLPL